MPTNNLAPKTKNYLSSIPPNMAERFGSAVSPYLQGVQELFPPTNPYGQALSNFLLGQAPQAAQRMAAGYPNVLFNTSNPLGGNRIVNPVALDMAAALPVATALKGAGLAKGGVAATFAGARAKTANHAALALAERMKAAGAPDEEIHKATGWFFGSADGKPRFEIPDDAARLNAGALRDFHNDTSLVRQSRLMQHPELSAAYPDTGNIPYRKHNNPGASYDPAEDAINIPQGSGHPDMSPEFRDTAVKSPALHELQHAIQQREGFAKGGSPEQFRKYDQALLEQENAKYALAMKDLIRTYKESGKSASDAMNSPQGKVLGDSLNKLQEAMKSPEEQYRRLAGEAEARLTQSRMDMTGAERAASYPPSMYDVPVGDQIVRYGDGPALATTWHGSPHKFEPTPLNDLGEFNAAKMGTGEGAQAYGMGHYTAEAPGVAKQYAKELGGRVPTIEISGQIITPPKGSIAEQALTLASGVTGANAANPLAGVADKVAKYGKQMQNGDAILQQVQEWQRLGAKVGSSNNLYKVDIPDEHIAQMLDWDKPLSEQAPEVRAAVQKLANERGINQNSLDTWRGEQILENFGSARNPELSAQKMRELGIPGIRYLDAGSRGAEGGTSNFVVFPGNEHMMTILERNGQRRMTEGELRHQTAQRNAALPVEQGGLGLPAGNTAVERAAAQGWEGGYWHETDAKNLATIDKFSLDPARSGAAASDELTPYAVFLKRHGENIKVAKDPVQMPMMVNPGREFGYTNRKDLQESLTSEGPKAKEIRAALENANAYDKSMEAKFNEIFNNKDYDSNGRKGYDDAAAEKLIEEWNINSNKNVAVVKQLITDKFNNRTEWRGPDTVRLLNDKGSLGRNVDTTMVMNPDNVRARTAAFDPFRRNAAIAAAMGVAAPDLLAGESQSPESQAIARYREIKGPKSVVRMEAALRTAGVPLPKNEPVAYIQSLVDRAHRRN